MVVHWIRNGVGVLFLLLGVVGAVLPVLQGWIFFVIGLGLIEHPWKHRAHVELWNRYAWYRRVAAVYARARARLHRRKGGRHATAPPPEADQPAP